MPEMQNKSKESICHICHMSCVRRVNICITFDGKERSKCVPRLETKTSLCKAPCEIMNHKCYWNALGPKNHWIFWYPQTMEVGGATPQLEVCECPARNAVHFIHE